MYTILICDYVQEMDYDALDAKHYALDAKGEVTGYQSICTGYQGRGTMRKGIWLKSMLLCNTLLPKTHQKFYMEEHKKIIKK